MARPIHYSDVLLIQDIVQINVPPENRQYERFMAMHGEHVTVTGLGHVIIGRFSSDPRKPGVYSTTNWVTVTFSNGHTQSVNAGWLILVNSKEFKRRVEEFSRSEKAKDWFHNTTYLRPLPDLPFWEGDIVQVSSEVAFQFNPRLAPEDEQPLFGVLKINYHLMNQVVVDGGPYPIYEVSDSPDGGASIALAGDELELICRGNVWNYYHGLTMHFDTVEDEANFYQRLGHTEQVRNALTGNFAWSRISGINAIRDGAVHGFSAESGFTGTDRGGVSLIRYRDEEVGKRIAAATLATLPVRG